MQKDQCDICENCGGADTRTRYFLRKRKSRKPCMINLNCIDCGKPFKVKDSEKEWKKHCFTCWLKFNGVPTFCSSCSTSIIVKDPINQDLCRACYIKEIGIKKRCKKCTISFYIHPKADNKTLCYDCYTKQEGVRKKCVGCKSTIFVLKKNLSWKNKCGECYYKI
jgi:hypothetical protein